MYVYADVIFIINIIMNSIILLLTAWIASINYQWWRILLAAVTGSFYVLISILPSWSITQYALFKILISLLLIVIAFGLRPIRIIFLWVTFFYVIAFILGGAVLGWLYLWQTNSFSESGAIILTNLSWTNLLCGSGVGVFFIVIALRRMGSRVIGQQNLYKVKFEYDGRTVELTGMLDSGNGLYTVIGHRPVIVVNQYAIEPILSQGVVTFLRQTIPELWLEKLDTCVDVTWLSRIQIIPYRAIGTQSILLAFRIDHLVVSTANGRIDVNDAVIAIYQGCLSEDGRYTALLHPMIMDGLNTTKGGSICA